MVHPYDEYDSITKQTLDVNMEKSIRYIKQKKSVHNMIIFMYKSDRFKIFICQYICRNFQKDSSLSSSSSSLIEHLLCPWHHAKNYTRILSSNPHNDPLG